MIRRLSDLLSPSALELLSASGSEIVRQIGLDVVRGVVLDILRGYNLRDSTEVLTRRRITALNLATLALFLKGLSLSDDFIANLPALAQEILSRKRVDKIERWLAQWMLGLTDKAFQNVLRDEPQALQEYRERYIRACQDVTAAYIDELGELGGQIQLSDDLRVEINWLWMTYLLNAIGAQTLTIRGSEKAAYGKLFEKLVLGSLLHVLGFKHILPPPHEFAGVFWLSSRGERRESDATLLYKPGMGVRFDIGFIGRGNPEISLDKVTRFEREISLGHSTYYMATIILVDRIGVNSRIEALAQEVGGTIIQMSASYWPKQVARVLQKSLGFKHPILSMDDGEIEVFLKDQMPGVPLQDFIGLSKDFSHHYVRETDEGYTVGKVSDGL
ncbi:MAG: CfrBI family restriction endonuclease [Anaerolineales bacterium]